MSYQVLRASSSSATRGRLLQAQAQLEAAKKLQALEEQELARKKTLVDLELKVVLAVIADASSRAGSSVLSGLTGSSRSLALQPALATVVPSSKVARVAERVRTGVTQDVSYVPDQAPSVDTAQSACAAVESASCTRELFAQHRAPPGILHPAEHRAPPGILHPAQHTCSVAAPSDSAPPQPVSHQVTFAAGQPASQYVAPPAVRQSAPAPAAGQSAPAPVTRLNAEAAPFMTAPMTSLGDSPGARELQPRQQLDRAWSELVMNEQVLHQTLGQVPQANPPTARAPPAPPDEVNPNKPGKLRLVFDAASKTGGRSLNDALLSVPDLLRPLPTVLFGYRERRIAFGADIAEMFHPVQIREADRDSQRFLWRTDLSQPPDVFRMKAMTFGATSSPSSAMFVKNHNAHSHPQTSPRLQTAIVERHYMDDYFDSTDTVEEATSLSADVIRIHRDGGFVIRHWISNSPAVLASVPETLRANTTTVDLDVEHTHAVERTLGLRWDTATDTLRVQPVAAKISRPGKSMTKRQALSTVMAVFDPLGLLACFTIRARVLLQDIWRSGIGWDDELPTSIKVRWDEWCQDLQSLCKVNIPRCYSLAVADATSIELHTFCDASEKAFGAASYWRFQLSNGSVATSLVMAKTRVAPLKPLSIPRLELQAAVLGARLSSAVLQHHSFDCYKSVLWSDSQTALSWIRADARCYKPFVAHRVGEIKELTNESNWR